MLCTVSVVASPVNVCTVGEQMDECDDTAYSKDESHSEIGGSEFEPDFSLRDVSF
jgi:hypothetical protein